MPEEISFGKWLRQRRRTLDLTQKTLAQQVGCAEVTVRQIEADTLKPSKELAEILLERLGIPEFERPNWIAFARGASAYPQETETRSYQPELKTILPIPLTSFVGRERDIERIRQRLALYRLVTLVGPGGIGKTRLAQHMGIQLLDKHANGVWLVELASLNDPALVPQTVGAVFGIHPQLDRSTIDILIQVLRAKTILLILDNCEHLLDACAQLVDKLLKHCPNLKILATSREALGIKGEALYQVASLTIPEIRRIESPEKLTDYESVRLFDERARLVQMDFALTTENALSVAGICTCLDGNPLAIELAAARINTFQVEEILNQLNVCFSVLASHNRTETPRHQTLRASMDWSWGLLSEAEQIFVRQLSVFAGGWTLVSAQAICEGNSLNLVGMLVKKSLIMIDQKSKEETRYHFHEIVRQYMRERLIESGEENNIRTRHLKYFLGFSEQAELALKGPTQREWFARLNHERDNIRVALEWAAQTDVEAGLYLSGQLHRFWESLDVREGAHWLDKFIENPESESYPLAKARALLTQGWLLQWLQQNDVGRSVAKKCLELYRVSSDQHGKVDALELLAFNSDAAQAMKLLKQALSLAQILKDHWRQAHVLGVMSWIGIDDWERKSYCKKAIALFRELGDWQWLGVHLGNLADFEMLNGDLESAQKWLNEATKVSQRLNNKLLMARIFGEYGTLEFRKGNYQNARLNFQESLTILESIGFWLDFLWHHTRLGYVAMREGNLTEAKNIFINTVHNFQKDGSEIGVAFTLEGMAGVYIAIDRPEFAARLIGWADATREKIRDRRPRIEQEDVDKMIAVCVEKMGKTEFRHEHKKGKKMSLDEAVAYALRDK